MIGAGSVGLVSAYIAAATKAKVAVVEMHRMGGDCLNTGCVPSKALIRWAKLLSQIARSKAFGIAEANAKVEVRCETTGSLSLRIRPCLIYGCPFNFFASPLPKSAHHNYWK